MFILSRTWILQQDNKKPSSNVDVKSPFGDYNIIMCPCNWCILFLVAELQNNVHNCLLVNHNSCKHNLLSENSVPDNCGKRVSERVASHSASKFTQCLPNIVACLKNLHLFGKCIKKTRKVFRRQTLSLQHIINYTAK